MRIAIITEGMSEFKNLPKLYEQLHARNGNLIVTTLILKACPDAPLRLLANECSIKLKIATAKKAELAIILLDREERQEKPGKLAALLEAAILATSSTNIQYRVIIKDKCFENWLIADMSSLQKQGKRFVFSKTDINKVVPNKADSCDAQVLIKKATHYTYDKVEDSSRICKQMDVEQAALNSRSFRHFLHLIGDRKYATQCLQPIP